MRLSNYNNQRKDLRIFINILSIRLTQKHECVETRILAAETLAFMIELSAELQRIAAISNHLIPTIASFLWWEPSDAPSMSELNTSLLPSQPSHRRQVASTSNVIITSRSSSPPITSITSTKTGVSVRVRKGSLHQIHVSQSLVVSIFPFA